MITPLTEEERIDEAAVRRIMDHLLSAGVDGLLLLGTTGEGASLAAGERLRLVELAVEHAAGRVQLYAGLVGNSLRDAVDAARAYRRAGVDALVAPLPSYYPLNAAQMRTWFLRLADTEAGPFFLYNIPMTTKMSISVDTVLDLAGHPNIAGIKDSEYDLNRMEILLNAVRERRDFAYFVGPSSLALNGLALGAAGFVPSVGNVLPGTCRRLLLAAAAGNWQEAATAQEELKSLGDVYQSGRGVGEAIALLKVGMSALGLCSPVVLPPLLPPQDADRRSMTERLLALAPRPIEA